MLEYVSQVLKFLLKEKIYINLLEKFIIGHVVLVKLVGFLFLWFLFYFYFYFFYE